MPGDIGFDPLQISDLVPLNWAREVRSTAQSPHPQQTFTLWCACVRTARPCERCVAG